MNRVEILKKIESVFRDLLDNEYINLNEKSSPETIGEWDSLTHIQLVVGVEKIFNIRFTSKEILSWENIKTLIDLIKKR